MEAVVEERIERYHLPWRDQMRCRYVKGFHTVFVALFVAFQCHQKPHALGTHQHQRKAPPNPPYSAPNQSAPHC
jgi:hypothetical protein